MLCPTCAETGQLRIHRLLKYGAGTRGIFAPHARTMNSTRGFAHVVQRRWVGFLRQQALHHFGITSMRSGKQRGPLRGRPPRFGVCEPLFYQQFYLQSYTAIKQSLHQVNFKGVVSGVA